jgi:transcription elongation factor Elf1
MAAVIGYDQIVYKRFTCFRCKAIVEYHPLDVVLLEKTDQQNRRYAVECPSCHRYTDVEI